MEIMPFEPSMAADVARCYSEVAASAPYCAPVGGEWFADLGKLARQPCTEEALIVAQARGEIAGFVHVGVSAPATEEWQITGEPGVIRFLAHRPGERPIGAALLKSAEEWLVARGRSVLVAVDNRFLYPFYYLPFGHLSERHAHLVALFGMAGYSSDESELLLEWPAFEPPQVERPDVDVDLIWGEDKHGSLGPEISLHVVQHGREVGECLMAQLSWEGWRPELSGMCFCSSLNVDPSLQGKGLGKYLLAQGLAKMHELGFRHAMISTDWNNYRAQLLYTNIGYRFLDRTFSFRKVLGEAGESDG